MRRDLVFKLHESSRGEKFPGMVDVYTAKPREELGQVEAVIGIDTLSNLGDEFYEPLVLDGKTVRCRLEIIDD